MKTIAHLRLIIASLVLASGVLALRSSAAEPPSPAGSIRITDKVAPADLTALAKISFQQALEAALAASPGSVLKSELEVEDGTLMYSFEIVGADKAITEVEIDAGNGKVLATDKETAPTELKPGKVKKESKEEEDDDEEKPAKKAKKK